MGQWLAIVCIDEHGHYTDAKVRALGDCSEDDTSTRNKNVVAYVWTYVLECIKKADIEWRVIIMKVGAMDEVEMQGPSVNLIPTRLTILISVQLGTKSSNRLLRTMQLLHPQRCISAY